VGVELKIFYPDFHDTKQVRIATLRCARKLQVHWCQIFQR
jgi:hypothetical protein